MIWHKYTINPQIQIQIQIQIAKHNEQIHTGEKPHAYRYCDKKFSQSEIAKRNSSWSWKKGLTHATKILLIGDTNRHINTVHEAFQL